VSIGISAGIGVVADPPADAGTPVPASGGQAATYAIGSMAQRAALAFWTPTRMKEATAVSRVAISPAAPPATPPATSVPASRAKPRMLAAPKGTPTAVHFDGVPTVGALFFTTGSVKHFCTASVTDSRPRDLVLTAAHCVYGSRYATNIAYVPMYHNGARPHGTWPVTSITVAARWRTEHDPDLDFAFLKVASVRGHPVQSVTKGLALGVNGSYAMAIQVVGYNDGDSQPVHCLTESFEFRPGQLEFYCHDYWDGTSGGPWISDFGSRTGTGIVHGVIGGYQQGGLYEWASFSPYFGSQLAALFTLAQRAG